jgi:hypothetical protein
MTYTLINSDSITVKAKFDFDAQDYKYLSILDNNVSVFKKKIKADINLICENSLMYSNDKNNYNVDAFISLLHSLITRSIRNDNEDYINKDLKHTLNIKLAKFTKSIKSIEIVLFEQAKKDIINELNFYENFIPQDIVFVKIVEFANVRKSYLFDLKQLVKTHISNV